MLKNKKIFQFRVSLLHIEPEIWRSIQIADSCTFWDLHIAIQDSMGWNDSHLHEFTVRDPSTLKDVAIGIPDDEGFDDREVLPGWEINVIHYLLSGNSEFVYKYDFGDSWKHLIKFEGVHDKNSRGKYPKCISGERACPPEDVGGEPGYERFLEIIRNPRHEEYKEMVTWAGKKFNPEKFDANKVKFDNPDTVTFRIVVA